MRIGGIQKCSLIDFPGKVSAVLFTQGCPWRCPYCHNERLVFPDRFDPPILETEVFSFLRRRREQLDGVVVSGGEPTIQPDLIEFIREIKKMGFAVKLDTNGFRPDVLEKVIRLELLDYIAMDVKAPLDNYATVAGARVDTGKTRRSISIIINSGIDHEFRTTAVPGLHTIEDLRAIGELVTGAKRYILQEFIPKNTLKPELSLTAPFPRQVLENLEKYFLSRVGAFAVR